MFVDDSRSGVSPTELVVRVLEEPAQGISVFGEVGLLEPNFVATIAFVVFEDVEVAEVDSCLSIRESSQSLSRRHRNRSLAQNFGAVESTEVAWQPRDY